MGQIIDHNPPLTTSHMEYKNATEYPLKYDRDGTRVRIIEETSSFYLALPETNWGWNERDTEPLPFMPDPEIYDKGRLSDEAPVGRYDSEVKELKRQIAELEEEVKTRRVLVNTIQADIESARERYEHIEEACQRHEWINELVDLANGNIQYVVHPNRYNFAIQSIEEWLADDDYREVLVIGKVNKENASGGAVYELDERIKWGGGQSTHIIFCENYEAALVKAQAEIDELSEYKNAVVETALGHGLTLDMTKLEAHQQNLDRVHNATYQATLEQGVKASKKHKQELDIITQYRLKHGQ